MIEELKNIKKLIDDNKKDIENYCKDKSINIEDRWKVLITAGNIGISNTSWRTDFDLQRDDEFLYDGPCYMSKYETRSVDSILKSLSENEDFNMTEEEKVVFKNYCLDNFYTDIKFDW